MARNKVAEAESSATRANSRDKTDWRRPTQHGRQKGCYVYIPLKALEVSLRPSLFATLSESSPGAILRYQARPWGKNRVIIAFEERKEQ